MTTDRTITLPTGIRVGYVEAGAPDGVPVLYFHGTPSCRLEAALTLPGVAERLGLRVLAPDRPGCGMSSFVRYTVGSYPVLMSAFLDALGVGKVVLLGVSGGGRYACACAAAWLSRGRRLVLVSSTASSDLPGVRASWSRQDRLLQLLAVRAPSAFRAVLAKLARDARRDSDSVLALFNDLCEPDRRILARPDVRDALSRTFSESLRAGTRGVAHDWRLEAVPWGIDFGRIDVPTDVWHGTEDTIVDPTHGRALVEAMPHAQLHLLDGEGHISGRVDRLEEVLAPLR